MCVLVVYAISLLRHHKRNQVGLGPEISAAKTLEHDDKPKDFQFGKVIDILQLPLLYYHHTIHK